MSAVAFSEKGCFAMKAKSTSQKKFVLQKVQPALLGLMDGAVSTLAPIFAVAGLTGKPENAFFVGLAASLGAGVSMGRSALLDLCVRSPLQISAALHEVGEGFGV